jgi:hypothetical protein
MGATNRPQDLDSAIMRRMPTRFHINQPVSSLYCIEEGSNCLLRRLLSVTYKQDHLVFGFLEKKGIRNSCRLCPLWCLSVFLSLS